MSASQSAVRSRAEAVKVSRTFDYLILFTAFFVILGGYHIHYMLTGGDWDFWTDWKDRRLWVTVAPIVSITFPARGIADSASERLQNRQSQLSGAHR
jgi:methane/ammonia monooxygenase subunit A